MILYRYDTDEYHGYVLAKSEKEQRNYLKKSINLLIDMKQNGVVVLNAFSQQFLKPLMWAMRRP